MYRLMVVGNTVRQSECNHCEMYLYDMVTIQQDCAFTALSVCIF